MFPAFVGMNRIELLQKSKYRAVQVSVMSTHLDLTTTKGILYYGYRNNIAC
jgi:hypothetical protein